MNWLHVFLKVNTLLRLAYWAVVKTFHERILDTYVQIQFTNTQGKTILGMKLEKEASDLHLRH